MFKTEKLQDKVNDDEIIRSLDSQEHKMQYDTNFEEKLEYANNMAPLLTSHI